MTVDNEFDFQIDFYTLLFDSLSLQVGHFAWDSDHCDHVHLDDRYHKYRLSFSIILGIYNGILTVLNHNDGTTFNLIRFSKLNH